MSDLKTSNGLFLGKEELEHLKKTMKEEGYFPFLTNGVSSWGIGRSISDTSFNSFKVVAGTIANQISVNAGYAFDSNLNVILNENNSIDAYTIPADGVARYVVLTSATTTIEKGTVSVDASGGLIGIGTLFTETLRGGPDFPSVITLNGSSNTGEYRVSSILNDTTAQLSVIAGSLTPETGLQYEIVGTFTPGLMVASQNKYPLIKNSHSISIETSNTSNGSTSLVLAQVTNNAGVLSITDLRGSNLFSFGSAASGTSLTESNKLIGWEESTFNHRYSDLAESRVVMGWGLKSETGSWSYDNTLQQFTVSSAQGGVSSIAAVADGDYDGWKVFVKESGQLLNITSSTYSTGVLLITVDFVSSAPPITSDITIVPDCDEVEFSCVTTTPSQYRNMARRFSFLVHEAEGNMFLPINTTYEVKWRHTKGQVTTPWQLINASNPRTESQHDVDGVWQGGSLSTIPAGTVITENNNLAHAIDHASLTKDNNFQGTNTFSEQLKNSGNYVQDISTIVFPSGSNWGGLNLFSPLGAVCHVVANLNGGSDDVTLQSINEGNSVGQRAIITNHADSLANFVLSLEDPNATATSEQIFGKGLPNQLSELESAPKQIYIEPGETVTLCYGLFGSDGWHVVGASFDTQSRSLQFQSIAQSDLTEIGTGGANISDYDTGKIYWKINKNTVEVQMSLSFEVLSATLNGVEWTLPQSLKNQIAPLFNVGGGGTVANNFIIAGNAYVDGQEDITGGKTLIANYYTSSDSIKIFFEDGHNYGAPADFWTVWASFSWNI